MRTRAVLVGLVSVAALVALALVLVPRLLRPKRPAAPTYWPTQGWRVSTPEEQGFDSDKLAEGLLAMRQRNIDIHSLLIVRSGSVLLDASFYPYDGTIVHDLASVTKSVMTTLIAIAAGQGKLQLDKPMVSFFTERAIANLDARKERITVRHLAGMVNGFESGCMAGDEATLNTMRAGPDWVQSALDRKMTREPGTSFCYDSPGMHLLSAILQKATGMTALDFARKNLFEPLGIRDVIWESDPQGYTHGWGDLHLKPRDAARIGYLWLNDGVWEGKRIVPAAWVKDEVKVHSSTGMMDNYGYGWWVSKDSYFALGRGGQHIKVYPSLNVIVVTTAGGLDYSQIDLFLAAAFINPDKPLPANPAGVAKLNTILTVLVQAPHPQPVAPPPDTAKAISGKTYVFARNPAEVEVLSLDFSDSAQAMLRMKRQGMDETWPIGLDGSYRLSPSGQGLRGYWADSQTFIFEIFDIAQSTRRLHFSDDRLVIDLPELGTRFEGQQENP